MHRIEKSILKYYPHNSIFLIGANTDKNIKVMVCIKKTSEVSKVSKNSPEVCKAVKLLVSC